MRIANPNDVNQRGHAKNRAAAADQPLYETDHNPGKHREKAHPRRPAEIKNVGGNRIFQQSHRKSAASTSPTARARRIVTNIRMARAKSLLQSFRRAPARLARQHNRLAARQLPRDKTRKWQIDRAGNMPHRIFMRLAHIDDSARFVSDDTPKGFMLDSWNRDAAIQPDERRCNRHSVSLRR